MQRRRAGQKRASVTRWTHNVFFDKDVFQGVKEKLRRYLEKLPSEEGGWGTMDGPAGMQLANGVCGVISTMGGAVHPY